MCIDACVCIWRRKVNSQCQVSSLTILQLFLRHNFLLSMELVDSVSSQDLQSLTPVLGYRYTSSPASFVWAENWTQVLMLVQRGLWPLNRLARPFLVLFCVPSDCTQLPSHQHCISSCPSRLHRHLFLLLMITIVTGEMMLHYGIEVLVHDEYMMTWWGQTLSHVWPCVYLSLRTIYLGFSMFVSRLFGSFGLWLFELLM